MKKSIYLIIFSILLTSLFGILAGCNATTYFELDTDVIDGNIDDEIDLFSHITMKSADISKEELKISCDNFYVSISSSGIITATAIGSFQLNITYASQNEVITLNIGNNPNPTSANFESDKYYCDLNTEYEFLLNVDPLIGDSYYNDICTVSVADPDILDAEISYDNLSGNYKINCTTKNIGYTSINVNFSNYTVASTEVYVNNYYPRTCSFEKNDYLFITNKTKNIPINVTKEDGDLYIPANQINVIVSDTNVLTADITYDVVNDKYNLRVVPLNVGTANVTVQFKDGVYCSTIINVTDKIYPDNPRFVKSSYEFLVSQQLGLTVKMDNFTEYTDYDCKIDISNPSVLSAKIDYNESQTQTDRLLVQLYPANEGETNLTVTFPNGQSCETKIKVYPNTSTSRVAYNLSLLGDKHISNPTSGWSSDGELKASRSGKMGVYASCVASDYDYWADKSKFMIFQFGVDSDNTGIATFLFETRNGIDTIKVEVKREIYDVNFKYQTYSVLSTERHEYMNDKEITQDSSVDSALRLLDGYVSDVLSGLYYYDMLVSH